jgi:hypothetical protein
LAFASAGNSRDAKIAMMAITTSSSIKVNALSLNRLPAGSLLNSFIFYALAQRYQENLAARSGGQVSTPYPNYGTNTR